MHQSPELQDKGREEWVLSAAEAVLQVLLPCWLGSHSGPTA